MIDTGVRAGDRVAIYMPMILELTIAMLACARIGAIHSVVVCMIQFLYIHLPLPLLYIHFPLPLLYIHFPFLLLYIHFQFPLLYIHFQFPLLYIHFPFPLLYIHFPLSLLCCSSAISTPEFHVTCYELIYALCEMVESF